MALSDGGGDEDDEEVYGVDVRKDSCALRYVLIFRLV